MKRIWIIVLVFALTITFTERAEAIKCLPAWLNGQMICQTVTGQPDSIIIQDMSSDVTNSGWPRTVITQVWSENKPHSVTIEHGKSWVIGQVDADNWYTWEIITTGSNGTFTIYPHESIVMYLIPTNWTERQIYDFLWDLHH